MIAMALALDPSRCSSRNERRRAAGLTVQAQVLELTKHLQDRLRMAIISRTMIDPT